MSTTRLPDRDRSVILSVGVDAVFHTIVLFSLFLLFAGHNAPGGGFVGGLVAGTALVLRWADDGVAGVRTTLRVDPATLLGAGMALAALTGVVPVLLGSSLLESGLLELDLPALGKVKTTSALPFDIGVYLVVVGIVSMILRTLGDDDATDPGAATAEVDR